MFIIRNRAIAAATAAAIALTSLVAATPASAGPHYRSHRGGGGNAAVLGAVAGVFGAIALMAASRRHQEPHYGYGYGHPAYAAPPPPYGYYGHRPYYR